MTATNQSVSDVAMELLRVAVATHADAALRHADVLIDDHDLTDVDWRTERLFPLAYRNMRELEVTHPLTAQLAPLYKRTWFENQHLLTTVGPFLDLLDQHGIRWAILKGGAMASSMYYDDMGARPLFDVDVLMDADRSREIVDVAGQLGWMPRVDRSVERTFLVNHAIALAKEGASQVDLHWELLANDRNAERNAAILGERVKAQLGPREIWVLPPTLQLFHALAHSRPEGFRHIVDVVTVLRMPDTDIDWERVIAEADARRAIAWAARSLSIVDELDDSLVPSWVVERLESSPRHWSDQAYETRPVPWKLDGLQRMAGFVAGRCRNVSVMDRLRIGGVLLGQYVSGSVDQIRGGEGSLEMLE